MAVRERESRIVLLGYGAINRRVFDLLQERKTRARVVGIIARGTAATRRDIPQGVTCIADPSEIPKLSPDLILEAASRDAVRQWGPAALSSAKRFVVSSASAFVDDELLENLKRIAHASGSQIVLSHGALAGIDALSACARLAIREVRHRIIKPPMSWGAGADTSSPEAPTTLFEGTAREAAQKFPLNANVTMVSALASLGPDKLLVELISDPHATCNRHEVLVSGDFGSMVVRIENRALRANPRSSELAALALVRFAENEVADLVM